MFKSRMLKQTIAVAFGLLALGQSALAVRIDSLVRLKGDQPNEIVGMGLVFGLKGTGDGGDSLLTMRPLQAMLGRFNNPVLLTKELKNANNVALVAVAVNVPPAGAHAGDKVDVKVMSISGAKSLKGGRLFVCPLQGPAPVESESRDEKAEKPVIPILGFASGDLVIEDESVPTKAIIRAGKTGGAVLAADFAPVNVSEDGKFVLAINSAKAGYDTASAIADQINEDVSPQTDGKAVATAVDATTVEVQIPRAELAKPAQFIARVLALPVPKLPGPAKITINSKSKTITFTGDVELAPNTLINHKGITISALAPTGTASAANGASIVLDPAKQGPAKLKDLMDALNVLKVSPDDTIAIVKELVDSGAIDAQLQTD